MFGQLATDRLLSQLPNRAGHMEVRSELGNVHDSHSRVQQPRHAGVAEQVSPDGND